MRPGYLLRRLLPETTQEAVEVLGTLPGRDEVRGPFVGRARYDASAAGIPDVPRIEP